jgi:hypothetical protein
MQKSLLFLFKLFVFLVILVFCSTDNTTVCTLWINGLNGLIATQFDMILICTSLIWNFKKTLLFLFKLLVFLVILVFCSTDNTTACTLCVNGLKALIATQFDIILICTTLIWTFKKQYQTNNVRSIGHLSFVLLITQPFVLYV